MNELDFPLLCLTAEVRFLFSDLCSPLSWSSALKAYKSTNFRPQSRWQPVCPSVTYGLLMSFTASVTRLFARPLSADCVCFLLKQIYSPTHKSRLVFGKVIYLLTHVDPQLLRPLTPFHLGALSKQHFIIYLHFSLWTQRFTERAAEVWHKAQRAEQSVAAFGRNGRNEEQDTGRRRSRQWTVLGTLSANIRGCVCGCDWISVF